MTVQELDEALGNLRRARTLLQTATVRHNCVTCDVSLRTEEVKNNAGKRFAFYRDRFVPLSANFNPVGHIYVATSPSDAIPGQGEPSGECPTCKGPLFCSDFHPA